MAKAELRRYGNKLIGYWTSSDPQEWCWWVAPFITVHKRECSEHPMHDVTICRVWRYRRRNSGVQAVWRWQFHLARNF